jgi:hypothetical protein
MPSILESLNFFVVGPQLLAYNVIHLLGDIWRNVLIICISVKLSSSQLKTETILKLESLVQ